MFRKETSHPRIIRYAKSLVLIRSRGLTICLASLTSATSCSQTVCFSGVPKNIKWRKGYSLQEISTVDNNSQYRINWLRRINGWVKIQFQNSWRIKHTHRGEISGVWPAVGTHTVHSPYGLKKGKHVLSVTETCCATFQVAQGILYGFCFT